MPKEKTVKIKDLIPDDKNFNKGSEFGNSLIEKSFNKFGAGRSILLDKNNRIIAGNKSTENYGANGGEDVIIVESDGTKLIAVKRTDIDLNTPQGREMALADNATAKANIVWAEDVIAEEIGIEVAESWGLTFDENLQIPSKTDLVEKTQLYKRVNYNFISLFKKSKTGIELSKLKQPEYFERIAYVFYTMICSIVKNKTTCLVCPPARRHKEWNLAQQLTKYTAEKIECNFELDLFEAKNLQKYSPEIKLKKELIYDNYVIIDDILTTGQTVDACVELLEGKNIIVFVLVNNN